MDYLAPRAGWSCARRRRSARSLARRPCWVPRSTPLSTASAPVLRRGPASPAPLAPPASPAAGRSSPRGRAGRSSSFERPGCAAAGTPPPLEIDVDADAYADADVDANIDVGVCTDRRMNEWMDGWVDTNLNSDGQLDQMIDRPMGSYRGANAPALSLPWAGSPRARRRWLRPSD